MILCHSVRPVIYFYTYTGLFNPLQQCTCRQSRHGLFVVIDTSLFQSVVVVVFHTSHLSAVSRSLVKPAVDAVLSVFQGQGLDLQCQGLVLQGQGQKLENCPYGLLKAKDSRHCLSAGKPVCVYY